MSRLIVFSEANNLQCLSNKFANAKLGVKFMFNTNISLVKRESGKKTFQVQSYPRNGKYS